MLGAIVPVARQLSGLVKFFGAYVEFVTFV